MLQIHVDIVPGGFEPLRRRLATVDIANATDLADISSYRVDAVEGANALAGTAARSTTFVIQGHARRQSVWVLLAKACNILAEQQPVNDPSILVQ